VRLPEVKVLGEPRVRLCSIWCKSGATRKKVRATLEAEGVPCTLLGSARGMAWEGYPVGLSADCTLLRAKNALAGLVEVS